MSADIKDAGPLADVVRYSIPWHGTVIGGVLYTGKNGVTRPWQQSALNTYDHFLVRVQGLPDPYEGEEGALRRAADALEGKEHTTYAIVQGNGFYGGVFIGKNLPGVVDRAWIWIDGSAIPWSITHHQADTVTYAGGTTLSFTVRRFGELSTSGNAAQEWSISGTLGDLGQSAPDLSSECDDKRGAIRLEDVAINGGKAVFSISSEPTSLKRLGFIEATFTMNESGPSVSLALLAGRAQALGTMTDLITTVITTWGDQFAGPLPAGSEKTITRATEITGRIIGYTYDADGLAVPVTVSMTSDSRNVTRGELLTFEPYDRYSEAFTGPGASAHPIQIGAHSMVYHDTQDLTHVYYDDSGLYTDQGEAGTTVVENSPDLYPVRLYNFTGPGQTHRINNKLYTAFTTTQTLGVVWADGVNATVVDGGKIASLNPATGELFYPLDTGHTFA